MIRAKRHKSPKKAFAWKGGKPKLSMSVLAMFRVNYRDLEKYLKLVYKMGGYSVKTATGTRGGGTPEIDVTGSLPAVANICQLIDNIRLGRRTRNLGLILDLLCKDGFIPAGKYIIDTNEIKSPIDTYAYLLNDTQDCLNPRCLAFKEEFNDDANFLKRATVLDSKLLRHQEELARNVFATEEGENDG